MNIFDLDKARQIAAELRQGFDIHRRFDSNDDETPPYEYCLGWNPRDRQYRVDATRYTRFVNIPSGRYEPSEIGWIDPKTESYSNPLVVKVLHWLVDGGYTLK